MYCDDTTDYVDRQTPACNNSSSSKHTNSADGEAPTPHAFFVDVNVFRLYSTHDTSLYQGTDRVRCEGGCGGRKGATLQIYTRYQVPGVISYV